MKHIKTFDELNTSSLVINENTYHVADDIKNNHKKLYKLLLDLHSELNDIEKSKNDNYNKILDYVKRFI